MSLRVSVLDGNSEASYEHFVKSSQAGMFHYSMKFRHFLEKVLGSSKARYLTVESRGEIVAALPAVFTETQHGVVLNSLPFFGSHGGVLVDPSHPEAESARDMLRQGWLDLVKETEARSATVISNPLAEDAPWYDAGWEHDFRDSRIGQLTPLPNASVDDPTAADALLSQLHSKTRNCVRKGIKSDVSMTRDGSEVGFRALWEMHTHEMTAMGGTPKPWRVFESIRNVFSESEDYQLYHAWREGRRIAALLVFFYNGTAEYFTPASLADERVYQPMSFLIYESMREAVSRGCRWWNWGGTWFQQTGVYQFKSRWGTLDRHYHYYTRVYDRSLLRASRQELLTDYPYFFVVPFSQLAAEAPTTADESVAPARECA